MSTAPAVPRASAPDVEQVLEGLNEEQKSAVTHGEGPLLIVAGAGTGKTQVITRRIAWLIATKLARPEQILALTFTDKAAAEMESRVDELVPLGMVGATIATFNAFCDRLVREHAIELGLTSQLRVESQAEILVFLRERLFELGLRRYLPLGNPDTHLHALYRIFDRARNEDVSPEQYLAFARALAAGAGADQNLRDRAERELELATAYDGFTTRLLAAGRVDFGSQITLALRLLRERPYLRREYQERFRWILIDEFQDTNHVQFELIRALGGESRNVTVVGDDDQSIYRFRGAKVKNLMEFLAVFEDSTRVLLRRNYRSGQAILDSAHRLIRHNDPERLEAKLGIDKRLITERRDAQGRRFEGTVELRAFRTGSDQSDSVAKEIAEGVDAGTPASHFAVLARAHHHLDPVAESLRARGVRFRRVGMRGLYSRPEVQLCLNVLRSVADPDDARWPFMALGDPLFGASGVDLAALNARAKHRNRPLLRVAEHAAEHDAELNESTRDAIRRFVALHRDLAQLATNRPTSDVLYALVRDSGMLQGLAESESAENLERAQNLNKLFAITTRVGRLLKRDLVAEFIPHLDLLIELGDDPAAAELDGDEDSVSLLTAHGAKGLEFPVVYLVDLARQRFPQYPRSDRPPFPPELRHAPGDDTEEHYREERRLFYVGMTRARDRLVLCHARDLGGRRLATRSVFVGEALDLPDSPNTAQGASALESIARYAPIPEAPATSPAPVPDDQPVTLSNTQIKSFIACPLQYYFSHVARVPLPANPTLMYGHAVHQGIRVWNQGRLKGLPVDLQDVLAAYDQAWQSEGFMTLAHEERMRAQGREALERFVRRERGSRERPIAVEMDFRFRIGSDQVIGRWDRIDERSEGIVLVDYKTSNVEEEAKADAEAKRDSREGQLGLYALAYLETRDVMPARVELDFVGSGTVGSAEVEPAHLDAARERVATAAAGIRSARFDATPAPRTCGHCDYRQICRFSMARRTP